MNKFDCYNFVFVQICFSVVCAVKIQQLPLFMCAKSMEKMGKKIIAKD